MKTLTPDQNWAIASALRFAAIQYERDASITTSRPTKEIFDHQAKEATELAEMFENFGGYITVTVTP